MIAAVCVEENGGMLFRRRRLSRDKALQADLLTLCGGQKLWIHSFSARLFADDLACVTVDDNFLLLAGSGEICFVEQPPLQPWMNRLEGVILYQWNRVYPSDQKLDLDLAAFMCQERKVFPGTSHPQITREIYWKK